MYETRYNVNAPIGIDSLSAIMKVVKVDDNKNGSLRNRVKVVY